MNNSDKRVIVYCRESRDDYGENYERIETQRDLCLKYCEDKGYTNIVEIILHDDVTGTSFDRYEELKKKIKNHEFDVLVMKDSSRFGRNQKESLIFLDLIQENGIELEFSAKKFDEDFFGLEAWFNERRAKDDSIKIKANLHHKMKEGKLLIRAYFGYKKINNELIIDEESAEIVRKIYNLYLEGYGYRKIASILNEERIPTPSQYKKHGKYPVSNSWNGVHVQRILTNQVYTGDMVSGKTEKVSFKSKKIKRASKDQWIITENHHEPIVDKETFFKIQKIIDSKGDFAPKSPNPSPFSGLMICGKCKSPMYINRSKTKPHVFLCGKYFAQGLYKGLDNVGCFSHRVKEEELFNIVTKHIDKLIEDDEYKTRLEEKSVKHESSQAYIEEMTNKTKKKIETLKNTYSQVYNDKLNGIIPEFLFINKTKEIQTNIEKLEQKIIKLEVKYSQIQEGIKDDNKFYVIMNTIKTNGIKRETAHEMINKIIVFDEKEITLEDKNEFNISDERFDRVYQNGGVIIVYNNMYQHAITNGWIREHIGTWRERIKRQE